MTATPDAVDVVCYGTISVDNVTYLPYLPSPRRDVLAHDEYDEVGGEALRVAIPLAAWGLRVLVVGNWIGTDRKAEFILQELARCPAIDTRYIQQHPNVSTPFTRTLVTADGERSRIAYHFDQVPKVELTPDMMGRGQILSVDAYVAANVTERRLLRAVWARWSSRPTPSGRSIRSPVSATC